MDDYLNKLKLNQINELDLCGNKINANSLSVNQLLKKI